MKISTRFGRVASALALLAAAAPASHAQGITSLLPHVAVGGVGSTLGLGGDVAIGFGSYVVVRAARNAGSIGLDQTFQSQPYNLFAKADNRSLMLDIHPFAGGIYVSVGKVQNRSTIALTGTPTNGSYTVNGQAYAADSVGSLMGAIRLPENPMFFGFGWDHTFGNAWGASITSRLGVLHQDKATLELSATGPYGQASNPAHAQFQAQLDAERANQEKSLDKSVVRNLPVLEIGLRVRLF
jgi:hypothetical protein